MKTKQVILNEHLNGIDVGNSNDAILDAMEEYATQVKTDELKSQCPEGHGKMKKTLTGVYWCVLCQKYYE